MAYYQQPVMMMPQQPGMPMQPGTMVAPGAQMMSTPTKVDDLLAGDGVMIKQLTNECCRCFICQPNIHWTMHPYVKGEQSFGNTAPTQVWIQEDAGYCGRTWSCWAPGCRATTYRVLEGVNPDPNFPIAGAPAGLIHEKGQTCGQNTIVMLTDNGPVRCPCCCYLPYLETKRPDGTVIGRSEYVCDECLFVPKFAVKDANGTLMYRVRPDTCFGGCCVECKCDGTKGKCCRVPYYIRDDQYEKIADAEIVDLWAGFKNECCTRKNIYGVKFPPNATKDQKATLVGTTLLIDIAIVEQEGA